MSRIVHLRTSERNIAACFELLSAKGLDTKIPISTAVHKVLSALIQGTMNAGTIPSFNESEAATLLVQYTEEPMLELSEVPLEFEPDVPVHEMDFAKTEESVRDEIEAAMEHVKSGGVAAAEVPDLPDVPVDAPPWEAFEHKSSFEKLSGLYPKDSLLEAAKSLPALQKAIEIVYTVVTHKNWGTVKTVDMVRRLAQQFQLWIDEHEGEK